jgi:hypothetical protein
MRNNIRILAYDKNFYNFFQILPKKNVFGNLFLFRYCTSNFRKMTFMAVNMMLTGALMIVLPFVKNFALLVTFRFLQVKKSENTHFVKNYKED